MLQTTDVIKGFSHYVLTKDVEQSKPHSFAIKFVHFGFFHNRVLHLPSLFIPQIDSYLSLIQGDWLSDGSCCGLDAAADSEQTAPGHGRHRTWIASDGLLYQFLSFSFSEDLFPFNESNYNGL